MSDGSVDHEARGNIQALTERLDANTRLLDLYMKNNDNQLGRLCRQINEMRTVASRRWWALMTGVVSVIVLVGLQFVDHLWAMPK